MNRTERRKNGIKTPKFPKSKYTKEELEKIIKKELTELLNESYTETLKRERYERLQPLIQEYQRQKQEAQMQQTKSANKSANHRNQMKKAITAYETQMEFARNHVSRKKVVVEKEKVKKEMPKSKVAKKSFFSKFLDLFRVSKKAKKSQNLVSIQKPKVASQKATYTKSKKRQVIKEKIYHDFERALRDFQNYSTENASYQYVRKGRVVKYEPRCL